ncbi:Holliday junction resolvase RuvX [Chitinivibrio alkaliphilus]|uniref:Putative pre-16S rRNA nuclease n=1 Tax=Chitinivibrio alkaliphilus ACht1 TaxID=1313304 RepID=U7D6Q9_9BACT|nr:Holliday junction resolvase RuvX [Chitinivibrio alkaliphilus]ERP31256.1 Holliday junction resolvase-like protein [Chitinivibrio alkaliphilus ACht1]
MKYMAIDYGMRRIGIAVSDPLGIIARPVCTIDRKVEDTFPRIQEIISQEEPEKLVFGLPLDHDDQETEMCAAVRSFVAKLYDKLSLTQPYAYQDESLSSVTTHRLLKKQGTRKQRRNKKNIDKIAACIFLEEFLSEL